MIIICEYKIKKPLRFTFRVREGGEQLNSKGWVSNIVKKEKSKGIPGMPTFLSSLLPFTTISCRVCVFSMSLAAGFFLLRSWLSFGRFFTSAMGGCAVSKVIGDSEECLCNDP